ncbi:MAG: hypothetical protein KDA45_09290 [Planctomycetales bacterium]|nr:hypothetical protein [Planctomycetales bacterium]
MRIIVMGTGPFAVPTCRELLSAGHDVPLVVTRPLAQPRPKKIPPRPVFDWARENSLEIFEPASINDPQAIAKLAEYHPDLFFVCDYGQILSKDCLSVPRLGGINLHGSLLPRHRGAAPVQWTLLQGDELAGVTVIHMTPGLDAGPALAQESLVIAPDETAEQLEPRLAEAGVAASLRSIELLSGWDGKAVLGELQDKSLVTRAPRFTKADGQLDFRHPAQQLVRRVRACQPWPGTFAELTWPEGKRLRLLIRAARCVETLPPLADAAPGCALAIDASELDSTTAGQRNWSAPWNKLIAVACSEGTFLIARLQPAGKREMVTAEFLRGHPLSPGARFLLPQ